MVQLVTQFGADSSSGIGALGINGSSLVIQLITFVLAFLILRKYAFAPILKVLQQRRDTIEAGVALGEQMRKERAALDKTVTKELSEARKQADAILADAQDAARDAARDAEAKAKTKADAIIAEAKAATQRDVAQARRQLEKEVVSLISDATEVIIDEKVDASKDAALITKALKGRTA